jgi:predicted ABC-type ATPase
MKTFVNIRGTNGSGKSTLARRFFGENDATVSLVNQTFRHERKGVVEMVPLHVKGRINPDTLTCVIGNYDTMAGGLDKVKLFAGQFAAIEAALALADVQTVVAEGVLASTVFGSWAEHATKLAERGHRVIWAFMTTPVEVCLRRIQQRNGGKPIKEELVRDKWSQIDKVRQRAELHRGITVVQLPFEREWEALQEALA